MSKSKTNLDKKMFIKEVLILEADKPFNEYGDVITKEALEEAVKDFKERHKHGIYSLKAKH